MKKIITLCIAIFFIASYSITAQNVATATSESTKEVTEVECQDKDNTKTTKKLTGFNFKKYKKSSCSGYTKKSSCCTKKEVKKCGDSSTKSCCTKKEVKKCGDSCTKSCCTKKEVKKCGDSCTKSCCTKSDDSSRICSDDKVMYQDAARRVRLAIANNEITAQEGYERLKLIKAGTNSAPPPPPSATEKTAE